MPSPIYGNRRRSSWSAGSCKSVEDPSSSSSFPPALSAPTVPGSPSTVAPPTIHPAQGSQTVNAPPGGYSPAAVGNENPAAQAAQIYFGNQSGASKPSPNHDYAQTPSKRHKMSRNKIYIYNDEGCSACSLAALKRTLKWSCPGREVEALDAKDVIRGWWRDSAVGIIIPGGADLPYCIVFFGFWQTHGRALFNSQL